LEQARILTESLSQMKGAAMKAGQLISLEMADYFPPEAAPILAQLQNSATSVSFEVVQDTLLRELGAERYAQLQDIEKTPRASASIAQIHKAMSAHGPLALKVQHLGVAESINSDLAVLQKVANAFCSVTQRQMKLDSLFTELKEVLLQETDFKKEADLLRLYRQKLNTLKDKEHLFYCPTVIDSLSTSKVLSMSWEEGRDLNQWMLQNPSLKMKEHLAHLVLSLYCHEFFDWGLVQTDPNFTNFLVRPVDDQVGLVLLDFGSTRQYERPLIDQYVSLLKAVEEGHIKTIMEKSYEFGLFDPRESEESKQLFVAMMDVAVEPFALRRTAGQRTTKQFDFTSTDYARRSQSVIKSFVLSLKYSPPPHRIIFLHRKLGGIFSLLKRLELKMDISSYWEQMVSTKPTSDTGSN
jgi:aarF domain-containing kinase